MCRVCVLGSLELVAATDGHHLEADLAKRIAVEEHASIKHERRLVHRLVHGGPVDVTEFFPFSRNNDRLTVLRGRERSLGDCDLFFDYKKRERRIKPCELALVGKEEGMRTLFEGNVRESLGEVVPDLRLFDLRIKNRDASALRKEITNEGDGSRFAGVSGVRFESKAEDGNVLGKSCSTWTIAIGKERDVLYS